MKKDILGEEDIKILVNTFYDSVKKDDIIGFIFHSIIGDDWSHHLPVMYSFWSSVLFNKQGYKGNVIQKHIDIDKKITLQKEHYDRWILLWHKTVDNLFEGDKAEEAKNRASLMIQLISMKVDWSRLNNSIQ
jgi:hemoglobin